MKKKWWIARDLDGTLVLFEKKPFRHGNYWSVDEGHLMDIQGFPQIKWDDEPVRVQVTIEVIE